MKPTILYICSWLDHKSYVGNFFIEQGELFSPQYNVVFLNFKKGSIRNLLKFKPLFQIESGRTQNGSLVIYASYPFFLKFGFSFLTALQGKICKNIHEYLNRIGIFPSLIHAQSLLDAGVFSYHYSKLYDVPFLLTEHNKISFINKSIYRYNFISDVLNLSKFNLVVSNEEIKQFACNDLFYPFQVVGNLVNDSVFNYSKFNTLRINPKENNFRIVTIGAYSKIKDHETLFRALQLLDPYVQNVDLFWVGPCSWGDVGRKTVDEFYQRFELKNIAVSILPQATREKVSEVLQSADVFVLSSLVEGFPVSVLEALASGVPVVSSLCGGVEDVIHDGNGRLFPIRDSQKLAEYLQQIFMVELIFDRAAISDEVIRNYGKEAFREKLDSYYNSLLAKT